MRKPEDKSCGDFDSKWPSLFNVVIESLDLREIVMTGRQFTWVGAGDNPTYEKLDRVLASTEWELNLPLARVEARDRNISDHTPLVVSTGASTHQSGSRPFQCERRWLLKEGFTKWLQIFGDQKTLNLLPYRGDSPRSADLGNILEAGRLIWRAPIKRRKILFWPYCSLQDLDKKS
jgi:hypothetical protein